MADPLSIAASIAGLLAAAGKVYTVVSAFIDSTANAPQSAAATLEAVGEIKFVLSFAQSIIDSLDDVSTSRKGVIHINHLSLIITNAVLTLSKLESLICQKDGIQSRLRWVWIEGKVKSLLPRLESQKTSLTLIFNVLQSHSNVEAFRYYEEMLVKLEDILEQNKPLAKHFQRMETQDHLDVRSVKFMEDELPTISGQNSLQSIGSSASQNDRTQSSTVLRQVSFVGWDFEVALQKSRVYSRSTSNQCDVSYTTSTAPTNAWTMLSGLSLNDISIVSAFRLPITIKDVHSVAPGSTLSASFKAQPLHILSEGNSMSFSMSKLSYSMPIMAPKRRTTYKSLMSRSGEMWLVMNPIAETVTYVKSLNSSILSICTLKVAVIGDANSLKSRMIHTFMGAAPATELKPIKDRQMCECYRRIIRVHGSEFQLDLRDTTGVEDNESLLHKACSDADMLLFLSRKSSDVHFESVRDHWIPVISAKYPRTQYLIVGTYDGQTEDILDDDLSYFAMSSVQGRRLAEEEAAFRYVDCDVGNDLAVRRLMGKVLMAHHGARGDAILNRGLRGLIL